MMDSTAARPTKPAYSTTRPLTAMELRRITYSLCAAIGRDGDILLRLEESPGMVYGRLRDAADALAAVTDHVCNDHRWEGDEEASPA